MMRHSVTFVSRLYVACKSSVSQRESLCPYFISKLIVQDVEIVFCPYNYLLDKNIRGEGPLR